MRNGFIILVALVSFVSTMVLSHSLFALKRDLMELNAEIKDMQYKVDDLDRSVVTAQGILRDIPEENEK